MRNLRFVIGVGLCTAYVPSARAGFQWTAANWTATPSTTLVGTDPGFANTSVGSINGDEVSASMFSACGQSAPSNSADAFFTFSRTFSIVEDVPGFPVFMQFRRIAMGTFTNSTMPGNHGGRYTLTAGITGTNNY